MVKLVSSFLLLAMWSVGPVLAEDSGQTLPGQLEENYYEKIYPQKEESTDKDVLSMDKIDSNKDLTKHFFPDIERSDEYQGSPPHPYPKNIDVSSGTGGQQSYATFSEKEVIKKFENHGKKEFSFLFIKDQYVYEDRGGIFKKTFEDGEGGIKAGTLLFSLNKYLFRTLLLNTKIGMNFGFGYNQGNGYFVPDDKNGGVVEQSEAQIKLWTVPVELSLGAEFNLTRFLKFQVSGGPTLMGLIQSRSDKSEEDDFKRIRQIGTGYFYSGAVKVSLSDLFYSSIGFKTLSLYEMSKMTLDFYMRGQNVSKFKNEDITISGTSYGVGFSFEFL